MSRKIFSLATVAASAVALSLSVVACSGDDTNTTTPGTDGGADTSVNTPDTGTPDTGTDTGVITTDAGKDTGTVTTDSGSDSSTDGAATDSSTDSSTDGSSDAGGNDASDAAG